MQRSFKIEFFFKGYRVRSKEISPIDNTECRVCEPMFIKYNVLANL